MKEASRGSGGSSVPGEGDTVWRMLWSGGIGDFLQYASFLPAYLERKSLLEEELEVFIEATNPANVRPLIEKLLPSSRVEFVPKEIHWTRVNPLITPSSDRDRVQRPAFMWLTRRRCGFEDWFLPHRCQPNHRSTRLLERLPQAAAPDCPTVAVSLRNKGALWWPDAGLVRRLKAQLRDVRFRLLGEPAEDLANDCRAEDTPLLEAVGLVLAAELYVGTDTGLATARELTGRPNVYCLPDYWMREMMIGLGYLSDDLLGRSGSVVVEEPSTLVAATKRLLVGARRGAGAC